MRNILFFFCLSLMACRNDKTTDASTATDEAIETASSAEKSSPTTEPLVFTTNLDNLRLRDQPGKDGKELARLSIGTKVYDTGEVSEFTTPLKLRGVNFDEPWIKIKTAQGISGWIYGGGLSFNLEADNPVAQVMMQKRLVGLFGKSLADDVESYRQNYNNAATAEAFAKVYDEGIVLREYFVDLIGEKIEVNHDQLPDLFWLKQAMPGYIPQLAAEGTIYYLFNDYKQFQQKALSTSGKEDDEMAELFFQVHKGDSIEHFYPAWFMQTWDYGGHSLLGKGIHSELLDELDRLNTKSDFFPKPINKLKNQLVYDITEQQSAYWESKEKVRAELDKIISRQYKLFTKEDLVLLEARQKMMENPEENKIEFGAREGR
ncbi:MAG: hypothetical protein ACI8YQ_005131 [Polaribacter sp.]|jgi:hypothetical protein